MDNNTYIQKMVDFNDDIYADTSALMDVEWLRAFSDRAEPVFKAAGKHITIPPAVRSELIRHFDSDDDEKRTKAMDVNNILAEHKELFQATPGKLDEDDIAEAFADKELLVMLLMNRSGRRQLLIANDRSLTRDAYDLNKLESCQGGRISVCHIDRFGQLQMCSCVTEARQKQDFCGESNNLDHENRFVDQRRCDTATAVAPDAYSAGVSVSAPGETTQRVAEQIKADHIKSASENEAKAENNMPVHNKRDWWKWLLAFTGGVAVGCCAGMYRNEIAQLLAIPLATA